MTRWAMTRAVELARERWGPEAVVCDSMDPNVARSGPPSQRYYAMAYPVTGYDGASEFTCMSIVAQADTLAGLFDAAAATGRTQKDSDDGLRALLDGFRSQGITG